MAATQVPEIPSYVLNDLCSRFVINIPEEERSDLVRIFFQIELAHWFYLDFYCTEIEALKPCGIKDFSSQIFKHCPFLSDHADHVDKILEDWKMYKMSVPTYGAILLDPTLSYVLLAQGYNNKASWGFPKGKVNEDETPYDCAIREVFEETGYRIEQREEPFFIEIFRNQLTRLYVINDVPMNTPFLPQSRNEIKSLHWFPVDNLPTHSGDYVCKTTLNLNPNNFFMVIPFMKALKELIGEQRKIKNAQPLVPATDKPNGRKLPRPKSSDRLEKSDRGESATDSKATSKTKRKTRQSCDDNQKREKLKQKYAQQNRNEMHRLYGMTSESKTKTTKAQPGEFPSPKPGTPGEQAVRSKRSGRTKSESCDKRESVAKEDPRPNLEVSCLMGQNEASRSDMTSHSTRQSLNVQLGLPGGGKETASGESLQGQPKFYSQAWLNFKLDVSTLLT